MKKEILLAIVAALAAVPPSAGAEAAQKPPAMLAPEKPVYPPDLINVEAMCYLEPIDDVVAVFQSVAIDVHNLSAFSEAARRSGGAAWARSVLDVGTGSGAVGFLLMGHGAGRVVGTDIDTLAVKNARYNARRLGFKDRFEARLVPEADPGAYSVVGPGEKFDLVVSDPPQMYYEEEQKLYPPGSDRRNYYRFDPGAKLLRSLVAGLPAHLTEGGRAWLSLRSPAAKSMLPGLAAEYGLDLKVIFSGRDDVDFEAMRFLPPPAYKDPVFYDGRQRMLDVQVYELRVKKGG